MLSDGTGQTTDIPACCAALRSIGCTALPALEYTPSVSVGRPYRSVRQSTAITDRTGSEGRVIRVTHEQRGRVHSRPVLASVHLITVRMRHYVLATSLRHFTAIPCNDMHSHCRTQPIRSPAGSIHSGLMSARAQLHSVQLAKARQLVEMLARHEYVHCWTAERASARPPSLAS